MKLLFMRQRATRPLFIRWDTTNYALLVEGRRRLQQLTAALAWLSCSKKTKPVTVVANISTYARTLGWKDP